MDTILNLPETGRPRRRYSATFKAEIVAACLQPGVSTTAIALANRINPNLLRRWIRLHHCAAVVPVESDSPNIDNKPASALVPVCVSSAAALPTAIGAPGGQHEAQQQPLHSSLSRQTSHSFPPPVEQICLELRRGDLLLNIAWPASQAEACTRWLRGLLP